MYKKPRTDLLKVCKFELSEQSRTFQMKSNLSAPMLILAPRGQPFDKPFQCLSPPLSKKFTSFTLHVPFSFSLLGTCLFIWTNESPLFFRAPFVAKLATLQAAGLSCGVWLERSGTLFSQTLHGLRWPPSDGSLRSGILRHCQFCLFHRRLFSSSVCAKLGGVSDTRQATGVCKTL